MDSWVKVGWIAAPSGNSILKPIKTKLMDTKLMETKFYFWGTLQNIFRLNKEDGAKPRSSSESNENPMPQMEDPVTLKFHPRLTKSILNRPAPQGNWT